MSLAISEKIRRSQRKLYAKAKPGVEGETSKAIELAGLEEWSRRLGDELHD